MGSIQDVQLFFYRASLKKQLRNHPDAGRRRRVNLDSAETVGILFDATELRDREIVLQYARSLKNQGKKVKLLGFFDNKLEDQNFTFPFYNRKKIDWALRPKGQEVEEFLSRSYDVLLTINTRTDIPTEYLAALARAGLKVGPCTQHAESYDLMIEVTPGTGLGQFIEQIEKLLKHTNVKPAVTPV